MRNLLHPYLAVLLMALPFCSVGQQAYSGLFHQTDKSHIYLYQISWEELRNHNEQMAEEGFELVDVEVNPNGQQTRYWAIWREGQQQTRIERAAGWENMLKLKDRMSEEGWTLQEIEGFLEEGKRETFLGIWTKGSREYKIWNLDSWEGLVKKTEQHGQRFFQLVDVEAMTTEWGTTNFLAVYQKLSPSQRTFPVIFDNSDLFYKEKLQRTKSGYAIVDYETFKTNGTTYLLGLYKKSNLKDNCRHRLDWTSFVAYQQFLGDSYKLADIELSEDGANLIAPPFQTNRIDQTPNITQMRSRSAEKIAQGAAPAAANGLAWLSERGFSSLVDQQTPEEYRRLALQLDGEKYMNPGNERGNTIYSATDGLMNYIEERGYQVEQLALHSIATLDNEKFRSATTRSYAQIEDGLHAISLDLAREGLVGNSIVLMQWGIYEAAPQDSLNRDFVKVAERWGTLVGYGINEYGNENPDVLIVHSPTSGGEAPLYLRVQELDKRIKLHRNARLQLKEASVIPASGQQHLEGALQNEGKRFSIWENILIIKLEEPSIAQSQKLGKD